MSDLSYSTVNENTDFGTNEAAEKKAPFPIILLVLFALVVVLTFVLVFIRYNPDRTPSSANNTQETDTRIATEAINHLTSSSVTTLSYPLQGVMLDTVTFADIFSSQKFATTSWDCSLGTDNYILEFSGVPLARGEFKPSNISFAFEFPTDFNGSITITSFSLSFQDGSQHLFSVNSATPSDRYISLVRTQDAFEKHMSVIFPDLAAEKGNSSTDDTASHKAFVL